MQYKVIHPDGAPLYRPPALDLLKRKEGDDARVPLRLQKQINAARALPFGTVFEGFDVQAGGKGIVTVQHISAGLRYTMQAAGVIYIAPDGVAAQTVEERLAKIEARLDALEAAP